MIDYIYEWARQRSSFRDKIEERVKIISSHLVLIMWAKIYDPGNRNIVHWKGELIGFCGDLALLKMGNSELPTGSKSYGLPVLSEFLI